MLTPDQISLAIANAQYALALRVNTDLNLMYGACQPKSWAENMYFKIIIKALQYQLNRQDYSSKLVLSLYNKVIGLTGFVGTIPPFDPNFQAPNTTIVIETGGVNIVTLNKTDVNLVMDGNGNYYLPFLDNSGVGLPVNSVPVSVLLNGVQIEPALDTTFTPQRIYGFANNATPQTIIVTVVTLL